MNECANFATDQDVDVVGARRLRLRIRGLVQGVGFRPHVWRLAKRDNLTGFALNDQNGVLMEVQGNVEAFIGDLVAQAPPLARIDDIESEAATASLRAKAILSFATASRTVRHGPRSHLTWRSATPASPKCSIPPTAAIFIRSSPARIADPVSR